MLGAILAVATGLVGCEGTEDRGAVTRTGGASTESSITPTKEHSQAPRHNFPRLVEINVGTGNTYSTVSLQFEPGRGQPSAIIEHSKDSIVLRPGSGKPVTLAGNQALKVALSPAVAGEIEPLDPNGPVVAEVRVLGFFEGRTALGIGLYGDYSVQPRVTFDREAHTLVIALRNPGPPDGPAHACGEVAFAPASDAGAFNIVARDVPCEVARNVAAQVVHHAGESYTTDSGFTCLPEVEQREPTLNIVYTCSRSEASVRFDL